MKLNVITGLPRSGSTLICNILNQNPRFWATSTSILPQLISNSITVWSNAIEFKADLSENRVEAENKLSRSLRAFCDSWHQRNDSKNVIFDKSRGWSNNIMPLYSIYPDAKVLVTVRDLRNVFSSVEKQHRKNPLLDMANPEMRTILQRANIMFSDQGMIGSCINGVEDIIRRKLPVYWVKFERFTDQPKLVINEIYEFLGEPLFEHDFANIVNTATDPDAYYNFKYPHEGSGSVKSTDLNEWKKFMGDDLANSIVQRFPLFNQWFGYQVSPQRGQNR